MRKYLKNIEIVGATMVYKEGEQCRWSLDWLYANCDRVCILLDNWDDKTEKIVKEYAKAHPKRTRIIYSDVEVEYDKNTYRGFVKHRFKKLQASVRECMLKEINAMNDEKPIDILIWPDSDEVFIDEFHKYLEMFWNERTEFDYMMLGFVEVYDSMQMILSQKMAPHGRVYRYKPNMTIHPWVGRTRYHPHCDEKRPWKLRHTVIHVNQLTKEYRQRRRFFENSKKKDMNTRELWILPKDVREMTADEIADYQPGPHQTPPLNASIKLTDYLNNKEKYINKYNLKLWTQD